MLGPSLRMRKILGYPPPPLGPTYWESIRLLVTSPFKLALFQIFCKNYCRKTTEATIMEKVPNESKLIYAINKFIVASWCLLFSHGSHLNTKTN